MRLAVHDHQHVGMVIGTDQTDLVDLTDLADPGAGAPAGPAGPLHRLIERFGTPERLAAAAEGRIARPAQAARAARSRRLTAPLPRPGKIVAAPVNYLDHKREMAETHTVADLGVFLKATSSVIGPHDTVRLPYADLRTDQEGELAVVIGRAARHIPPERALEYVFGYTCALDVTVRSTEDRSTRKSFDTFTPLGPWLVTADEVGDPAPLRLRCAVNGEIRQDTRIADLIFDVPQLVAYVSSVMTLWPGDVILTGTPAGVGPLADGDRITVDIERVGRLEVDVSARDAIPYASRPGPRVSIGTAS